MKQYLPFLACRKSSRTLASVRLRFVSPVLLRAATLLIACGPLAYSAAKAAEAGDDFRIRVRSTVERRYKGLSKESLHEHGKLYAIISVDQVKADTPLAKPVNEPVLFAQLQNALASHGFRAPAPGTNPEIVLTVLYGRSLLRNPYTDKSMATVTGMNFGGASVVVASSDQVLRERQTPGYESKRQDADTEKLFISVTAWKFPSSPKEKPQKLWITTIYTDDPAKDLNLLSAKMLAGGAGYFDRQVEQDEITLPSDHAHVNVGTPTVIEPTK